MTRWALSPFLAMLQHLRNWRCQIRDLVSFLGELRDFNKQSEQ